MERRWREPTARLPFEKRHPLTEPGSDPPAVRLVQGAAYRRQDLSEVNGLGQRGENVLLAGRGQELLIEPCRHQDARRGDFAFPQATDGFNSIQSRHVHIEQQQVDGFAANHFERLFSVGGQQRLEPARLEGIPQRLAKIAVVIGDQDGGTFDQHPRGKPVQELICVSLLYYQIPARGDSQIGFGRGLYATAVSMLIYRHLSEDSRDYSTKKPIPTDCVPA